MAHGAVKNFWTVQSDWHLFDPLHANIVVGESYLTRQNYYTLRVAAATKTDFELASDLSVPSGYRYDLSDYEDVIFGFKDLATDTDYIAAWQGYNTGDTAWHDLSAGRFSIDVAPTTSIDVDKYVATFRLINGTSYLDIPALGLGLSITQNVIIGTEPSTPSGVLVNSGTATITAGSDNVVVTDANMTATGLVIPFFVGPAVSSIAATPASGSFTISVGGPVASNTTVGYYIVSRS